MAVNTILIPAERIEKRIFLIRGHKVMLLPGAHYSLH
jgi:hypothetical protein